MSFYLKLSVTYCYFRLWTARFWVVHTTTYFTDNIRKILRGIQICHLNMWRAFVSTVDNWRFLRSESLKTPVWYNNIRIYVYTTRKHQYYTMKTNRYRRKYVYTYWTSITLIYKSGYLGRKFRSRMTVWHARGRSSDVINNVINMQSWSVHDQYADDPAY